jgi:formylglycine-generating enzyme
MPSSCRNLLACLSITLIVSVALVTPVASKCCGGSKSQTSSHSTRHASEHAGKIAHNVALDSKLIALNGGEFWMGSDSDEAYFSDGEGPERRVMVDQFQIDDIEVSNHDFERFVHDTHYVTDAEQFGWSFVFEPMLSSKVCQLFVIYMHAQRERERAP